MHMDIDPDPGLWPIGDVSRPLTVSHSHSGGSVAKSRKKRQSYTEERRTSILAAAKKGGLTAAQVQKKYGVTPVTYYSWRKKTGITARRGGATRVARRAGGDITSQVRSEVQNKVRQILPEIVRREVSSYLDSVFGGRTRRARV